MRGICVVNVVQKKKPLLNELGVYILHLRTRHGKILLLGVIACQLSIGTDLSRGCGTHATKKVATANARGLPFFIIIH